MSPYKVGIQRGIKFVEKGVANVPGIRLLVANTNTQIINALDESRIDLSVLARLSAINAINETGANHILIQLPPIVSHKLYHYLHKKHQSLAPSLTTILDNMTKEGLITKIREDFIRSLLADNQQPL